MADSVDYPVPCGAAGGIEAFPPVVVNRVAREAGDRFKVVSFNGHGCGKPALLAQRLSQSPLAGAGLIFLCEVDWGLRRSQQRDCAGELAHRLGMNVAFGAEFGFGPAPGRFTAFFGNAILSAMPLLEVQTLALPLMYDWTRKRFPGNSRRWNFRQGTRGAIVAKVMFKGRAVSVAVIHLESLSGPLGRAIQAEDFLRRFPPHGPAIVGGDFNTTTMVVKDRYGFLGAAPRMVVAPRRFRRPQAHEPLFGRFEQAGIRFGQSNQPLAPTFTFSSLIPRPMRPKLDWIGLRELQAVPNSARVVSAGSWLAPRLSDHDFITCEVTG
jgi:endonuclease/exonuclease/phosphatase family metal-dependent hydrolase